MNKPIKVKPSFYAYCFENLKSIAYEFGYNLVLHGSMSRDFDLIAIPWIDNPKDEFEMIKKFNKELTGLERNEKSQYLFSVLPGGRKSYVINLNRAHKYNDYKDAEYYIDISVTPFSNAT